MSRLLALSAAVLLTAMTAGCDNASEPGDTGVQSETETVAANPLLEEWTGPYGGVPPWDRVKVEDFLPAFEASMATARAEINDIANNPDAPTFENTIAGLERSGRTLGQVQTLFGVHASTLNIGDIPEVERAISPKLAGFFDELFQNAALFKRIDTIYNSPQLAELSGEQQRLTEDYYKNFERAGARLDDGPKARLSEINQRLATLFTSFRQNMLADESGYVQYITDEVDLAGLPEWLRSAASAAAETRDHAGQWAITNTRSSMDPFLTYSDNRPLRETVWRTYYDRGDNGGEHDNNTIITEILSLRAERAGLLGYETHAHWRLERQMAKTPEAAIELMEAVWTPAVARVREEVADMQAIADAEGANITIKPWDYRYYAEKVRKAKYDLDMNAVKPYMQLEKLREGMFWASGQLYGFQYREVDDVPVYHPDVRVWEVTDAAGEHVGLWFFDPYARPGKRSGAWMNAYRTQERFDGEVKIIVSNNSNFIKGEPGAPVLISWTDAETMFHEFGHAIHGLNSNVSYPTLSGTSVSRDYVEFPSQLNEHWLSTPEVLSQFALHYETGEPIPQALVDKIEAAATFNQGFDTVEYLASALVDMRLHTSKAENIDPDAFERETLAELGMPEEIVMRHRTPHFAHIFAGDSYSAGYYSYLWADTLTADAAEAFKEAGGFYDKETAERLRANIMSVGNTIDPAAGFRAFRGRDVEINALMRDRGFPVTNGDDQTH